MTSILDHPLITERYFFPRDDEVAQLRSVETRDSCVLHCSHVVGSGDWSVVHFHGNGETASDWEARLGPFVKAVGWSLVLVEYRGYGGSSGAPALATMLGDGEDVIGALGLRPERTVAFGRSVGSLYAVELAARLPLAGLVLDSGIHDLAERLLLRITTEELGVSREEFDADVAAHFDQAGKLGAFNRPVLLLHAKDDELVGVENAHRNARACRQPSLHVFDVGGHNTMYSSNRVLYDSLVRTFLLTLEQSTNR